MEEKHRSSIRVDMKEGSKDLDVERRWDLWKKPMTEFGRRLPTLMLQCNGRRESRGRSEEFVPGKIICIVRELVLVARVEKLANTFVASNGNTIVRMLATLQSVQIAWFSRIMY